jgi:WD40 repeat protein
MRRLLAAVLLTLLTGCAQKAPVPGPADLSVVPDEDPSDDGLVPDCYTWDNPHRPRTTAVALSPDGRFVLTGHDGGGLMQWELPLGKQVRRLHDLGLGDVTALAFTPDSRRALSGSSDGALRLWDLGSGQVVRSLPGTAPITAAALAPDGRLALAGHDGGLVELWDVNDGKRLRTLVGHSGRVLAAAFSADGRLALSGGAGDRTARLWDVGTGRQLRAFTVPDSQLGAAALSPSGRFVVTAESGPRLEVGSTLRLWEAASGREVLSWPADRADVKAIVLTPDGRQALTVGELNKVPMWWDLGSGRLLRALTRPAAALGGAHGAVLGAGGRQVLLWGDWAVLVWDRGAGQEVCHLMPWVGQEEQASTCIAFSRDGSRALTGDDRPALWDVATGREVHWLEGHKGKVWAVAFAPDGRQVLTGGDSIKLWDVTTGQEVRTFTAPDEYAGPQDFTLCLAFSADGRWALSGGNGNGDTGKGSVKLWDVGSGRMVRSFEQKQGVVDFVAFVGGGKQVVSCDEGTLDLWEAANSKLLRSSNVIEKIGHREEGSRVALAPDGRHVLLCGGNLRLWDIEAGRVERVLARRVWARAGAFSPDGKLALWVGEFTPVVTEVATGKVVREFPRRGCGRWLLAFSPDGRLVRFQFRPPRLLLYDPLSGGEFPPGRGPVLTGTAEATELVGARGSTRVGSPGPWETRP